MCTRKKSPPSAPRNTGADYLPYNKEGPWWTCSSDGVQIKQSAESGPGSFKSTPLSTWPTMFSRAADVNGQKPALKTSEYNSKVPAYKKWKTWTWREYFVEATLFAKISIEFGLQQHDAVAICGDNSPEWAISMMGSIVAGAKCVGLFPDEDNQVLLRQLQQSNAKFLIVQSLRLFDKAKLLVEDLPNLDLVLCWGARPGSDIVRSCDGKVVKSLTFATFLEMAMKIPDTQLEERAGMIRPEHCCAVFHDRGSVKGAMFSHDNLHFATRAAYCVADSVGSTKSEFRVFSSTQFPAVNAVVTDILGPIAISANLNYKGWAVTSFSQAPLLKNLKTVRPSFVSLEPKVWEDFSLTIRDKISKSSGAWQKLMTFAQKKSTTKARSKTLGSTSKPPGSFYIAGKVLNSMKKAVGLDNAQFLLSYAYDDSTLSPTAQIFFDSLGIRVNTGCGVTECCGMIAWSSPKFHNPPAIGYECPGVEIRIGEADDGVEGNIRLRSRCVMMGYLANPALGKDHVRQVVEWNQSVIDDNGWLHTSVEARRDESGSGMIYLKTAPLPQELPPVEQNEKDNELIQHQDSDDDEEDKDQVDEV